MTGRSLCIHGHFYQPARENPWLDEIEAQVSAAPYHDWNERITAECYGPNAAAGNYERMSWDFGPTLLRWLARHAPETYAGVLDADRRSRLRLGRGNAIACGYNHLVMPLASRRDKITQVIWGITDFERRFGRRPDGMWLPEAAVDVETLEVLAGHGIAFTILGPHQAARVRPAAGARWTPVTENTMDVSRPYRCDLSAGRSIAIVFYDRPLSFAIAFEGVLSDAAALAGHITSRLAGVGDAAERAGMLMIAADGESYGHHHRGGETVLAEALDAVAATAHLTNPAAYLAAHPPAAAVEIIENTSWSCAHGIERWRSDCGCNSGRGWHQRWRAPLREAITWLKAELDRIYEASGTGIFDDPWAARDDALVVVDGTAAEVDEYLAGHVSGPSTPRRRQTALRLVEMQRQAMLMQSSDAWFSDEISGVENVQILAHAARAVAFAHDFGDDLEPALVARLAAARGNVAEYPDGAAVYERLVWPIMRTHPGAP